ncbi:aspartyl-tRNA amidotransferase [Candidatus Berkelbacteria bacterium RIFCSPHIGHO2_12_FULL_36_9]|uniref:Aspartyl-tRNA amidotransferase n=1 Tax=Candidatus Berkelbacteria bacterium RIFCSPHIGHO2_12_FULL_36_9 TaxID=1797469 RepID=A0A1F5EK80_9BACT|nr:MAG: aspartyl-tRNA amidotransferase [Candidatus Berkelbacteria bacterium RIFCSPHIGHO2_12_FULL_36_9]
MNLKEKIDSDLVDAIKNKDELKSSVLRMVKASIKNKEIALGKELDDLGGMEIIAKEIKQRKDSIEQFKVGNRSDLAEKEEKEITIISGYLPKQLSEEEVRKIIVEAIFKTNASSTQDMGKVMGMVMPQLKGKADGTLVSKIVKEKLQG